MRLKTLAILSILLLTFNTSRAQSQFSLDAMLKPYEIVSHSPLKNVFLKKESIGDYQKYLEESAMPIMDSAVFIQLIANSNKIDSTRWTDEELKKAILVKDAQSTIRHDYVVNKFRPTTKKSKKRLKVLVDNYNHADDGGSIPTQKIVREYSRPVYDNSGTYAAVAYDIDQSGRGVRLYHLINGQWAYVGTVEVLAY